MSGSASPSTLFSFRLLLTACGLFYLAVNFRISALVLFCFVFSETNPVRLLIVIVLTLVLFMKFLSWKQQMKFYLWIWEESHVFYFSRIPRTVQQWKMEIQWSLILNIYFVAKQFIHTDNTSVLKRFLVSFWNKLFS